MQYGMSESKWVRQDRYINGLILQPLQSNG